MNLNKDPESWARVIPSAVLTGSRAQAENVLTMALFDIQKLGAEVNRLRDVLAAADHTLHAHGKIDVGTSLHEFTT